MVNYNIDKKRNTEIDWFEALAELARFLRSPEGCPWDRKQAAGDFARFAREELDELLEAFSENDVSNIEEEFGDVFFCLLAVAAAAEEEGRFTLKSALERIHEKMIRRHGHVFGDNKAETALDAMDSWNEVKAKEKGNPSGC